MFYSILQWKAVDTGRLIETIWCFFNYLDSSLILSFMPAAITQVLELMQAIYTSNLLTSLIKMSYFYDLYLMMSMPWGDVVYFFIKMPLCCTKRSPSEKDILLALTRAEYYPKECPIM